MSNKLTLDLSDPDVAAACGDCQVGESKTFSITGDVSSKTDKAITFNVTDIEYDEGSPQEEATDTEGEGAEEAAKTPSKKAVASAAKQSTPY